MAVDPKQASTIVTIGTGICVGLIGYLAYVMISILATMKTGAIAIPPRAPAAPPRSPGSST